MFLSADWQIATDFSKAISVLNLTQALFMAVFALKLEALCSSEMFAKSNVQEVSVVPLTPWTELFFRNQAARRIRHLV
jgi:hypothetical protein